MKLPPPVLVKLEFTLVKLPGPVGVPRSRLVLLLAAADPGAPKGIGGVWPGNLSPVPCAGFGPLEVAPLVDAFADAALNVPHAPLEPYVRVPLVPTLLSNK